MVVTRRWLLCNDGDTEMVLKAALIGSYESLYYLVYRGLQVSSPLTGSICATVRAWDRVKVLMHSEARGWPPDTLLWFNPRLSHFGAIADPILLTFEDGHNILNWYFYLQLRQAFRTQFCTGTLELQSSSLEQLLCD